MSTIFSKIITKEIPAKIVYEDELCLAFHDIQPQAPTHVILIPKEEIRSMAQVTPKHQALLGHLMVKASEVASLLGLSQSGYRLVTNTNEHGGQTIFHLHIHILGQREMTWPPG